MSSAITVQYTVLELFNNKYTIFNQQAAVVTFECLNIAIIQLRIYFYLLNIGKLRTAI